MNDISAILLTFNEEANLEAALDSVKGWARETFVVDSYSTDRTVDVALSRAADNVKVVQHTFEHYSAQWNWALTHLPISSGWTLKLDADERVTPEFQKEVTALIASSGFQLEGIYFRRRIIFMGKPLHWGGMLDNYDLRMWRTGKAIFDGRTVNEHALVQGLHAHVKSFIDHRDSKSLSDWIEKHNRYSSMEARCAMEGNIYGGVKPSILGMPDQRRMWLKSIYHHLPCPAMIYFLYRYFLRFGFCDGRAGFRYAFLCMAYRYWIDLKIQECRRTGNLPEIIWPARGQPHPIVAQSELQRLVDRQAPIEERVT